MRRLIFGIASLIRSGERFADCFTDGGLLAIDYSNNSGRAPLECTN
jgi:tRNA A22 N-methylase